MRKRVLLFEPLQADQQAFRDALRASAFDVELIIAGTLTETMAYLSGNDFFRDRYSFPLPHFCVFNVNDLHGGGFGLLRWIRADVALHNMKVLALAERSQRSTTQQAYDLPFDAVLLKPFSAADVLNAFDLALQSVPLSG
jgi:DNA-binding response OmpR family regulator